MNTILKVEPYFDCNAVATLVTEYKVTDQDGCIWFIGTSAECFDLIVDFINK